MVIKKQDTGTERHFRETPRAGVSLEGGRKERMRSRRAVGMLASGVGKDVSIIWGKR